jgi:ribokinase
LPPTVIITEDVGKERPMLVAVVGHTEWVRFVRLDAVPPVGGIAHAPETWEDPGGGGAVAATQLAKLAGTCRFFTTFGDDELGRRSRERLEAQRVEVHAAVRSDTPTRSAMTMVDEAGERTIVTVGKRLEPRAGDALPWELLARADGVYLTASDEEGIRLTRRARLLVVTSRVLGLLGRSGVQADVVVGSARDPAERYDPDALSKRPGLVVRTEGASGGRWENKLGDRGRYEAEPLPGQVGDAYGAGDSFQAGLTYGLAAGMELPEALRLAARCGAKAVTGRGPTGGQLTAADL